MLNRAREQRTKNLIPEMKTMRSHPILTAVHEPVYPDFFSSKIRTALQLVFLFTLLMASSAVMGQLGIYQFTGNGACPTQNPVVASQPSNAIFSNFSTVNTGCKNKD